MRNRETAIAIGVSVLGVGCMAVDHLVGTESEPGESDAFPVDPAAFFLSAAVIVVLAAGLFGWLVRRAVREEPERAVAKAIAVTVLAVLTLPLLFIGVPFPLAGAGAALGLYARAGSRRRVAGAVVGLDVLLLGLGSVAYLVALAA